MKKRLLALWSVMLLSLTLYLPAAALTIPTRPDNHYVLDEANVISDQTEKMIIEKNQEMFKQTGAEFVIVAVDFISGSSSEEYAYEIFNDWKIGSSQRNNGLLLIFATQENKVWLMPGSGLNNHLSASALEAMLEEHFYTDYDNRNYDRGVEALFNHGAAKLTSIYTNLDDEYSNLQAANFSQGGESVSDRPASPISTTLIVLLSLFILFCFVSAFIPRRRPYYYGRAPRGGFWQGMFLGSLFGGGHGRRPPRGPWGGGRSGGGGGGGGGFSGGGGSFGGGAGRG